MINRKGYREAGITEGGMMKKKIENKNSRWKISQIFTFFLFFFFENVNFARPHSVSPSPPTFGFYKSRSPKLLLLITFLISINLTVITPHYLFLSLLSTPTLCLTSDFTIRGAATNPTMTRVAYRHVSFSTTVRCRLFWQPLLCPLLNFADPNPPVFILQLSFSLFLSLFFFYLLIILFSIYVMLWVPSYLLIFFPNCKVIPFKLFNLVTHII